MQIDPKEKPEHIGIILDGNRRWASARDLIPWEGHREGAEKVKKFLQWCIDLDIRTVTLYGFSTENFQRSKKEVEELMKLYEENLREVLRSDVIHKHRVCIRAIGRTRNERTMVKIPCTKSVNIAALNPPAMP